MTWCEARQIDYVFGFAKNERLKAMIAAELQQARQLYEKTKQAARVFKDFRYETRESWTRERRVIGKAEHLDKGANPRFVVTSIDAQVMDGQNSIRTTVLCPGEHGEPDQGAAAVAVCGSDQYGKDASESAPTLFLLIAYVLMQALRRLGLRGTEMAAAQCHTIRLKLFKVGAQVKVTVRKVWVSLAGGYPAVDLFRQVYDNLLTGATSLLKTNCHSRSSGT